MYGNYDGNEKALPEFDLYLNVNFWSTVKFNNASEQVYKEILSFAESETIYVCLVNKGKGTPFISALELRPVNSSIYASWDSIITSAYVDVFQNGYWPPDEVIKTAASPKSDADPLELSWTSEDPNTRFYAYLYFAELEKLEKNESRKIKILWNGSPVSETSFIPSSKYSMTFSNSRAFSGKDHLISVQKTADSTLRPIRNAIEIFTAQFLDEFPTTVKDVHAIENIKSTYKVIKLWTGDPCSPRLFPWEGAYSGPLLPSGKRRSTYSEVSTITNNFNKVIGKGGFGIVYLGCLEDGAEIAVKMIKDSSLKKSKGSSSRVSKEFQVEAELLLTVHHQNLASFVGYCDDGRRMALIYEYMASGNLQDYLSSENAEDLSWEKRLRIAIDSAQGLEYLHHGCRPPIVHRDVKTANILLNDNLEAKIADFGVSKVFPEDDLSHIETVVMGTPGYIDPEYYRTFMLNEKSDVYSFGVVLLEIFTGQRAIVKTEDGGKISVVHFVEPFFEIGELDGVVDPRLRGDFSSDSAWKFVEVAMSCVRDRGANRPTMNQIVSELKHCLAAELAREPLSHEV
ncbi:unnamed protein product [Arabis nemorensis]|uniref:Protein kinase domain-containing protein n=1 Tax=Arabis nemorensis TaxID=586526 RepID=A0A565CC08_9BRAS|nr:unnamed protein product [Arabis nemorensis]